MNNNINKSCMVDNAKQLTYSNNSWRNYLEIYDRVASCIVEQRIPNNAQIIATIMKYQTEESQIDIDELVRTAFYCAFTTVKQQSTSSKNKDNQCIQQLQYQNEKIFINEGWLEYFSNIIKTKSRGSCIFRIKSFKNRLSNSNNLNNSNNNDNNNGGLFGKFKGLTDPFTMNNNNNNNNNNNSNNNDNIIKRNSEFRNGYFVEDLEVDENEDSSTVLRYRYEKDFVLIRDGAPTILTLSPDWGMPFHIKEQINLPPPPVLPSSPSGGKHNKHHQSKKPKQNTENNSQWGCNIM